MAWVIMIMGMVGMSLGALVRSVLLYCQCIVSDDWLLERTIMIFISFLVSLTPWPFGPFVTTTVVMAPVSSLFPTCFVLAVLSMPTLVPGPLASCLVSEESLIALIRS